MLRPGATGMRISGTLSPRISKNSSSSPSRSYSRAGLPAFELDDQLDALRRARRRDAEQILHVDDAEAAQLHVMAGQLGTGADQDRLRAAPDLDGVVGDQTMAADDQVERALALADAALADDQDAEAEDVHQHGVHHRPLGQGVLENRRQLGDGGRRGDRGLQQRQLRALGFDAAAPRGGSKPPVMSTHGNIERQARAAAPSTAPPASRLSR